MTTLLPNILWNLDLAMNDNLRFQMSLIKLLDHNVPILNTFKKPVTCLCYEHASVEATEAARQLMCPLLCRYYHLISFLLQRLSRKYKKRLKSYRLQLCLKTDYFYILTHKVEFSFCHCLVIYLFAFVL